jgi:calcium binding protein 39
MLEMQRGGVGAIGREPDFPSFSSLALQSIEKISSNLSSMKFMLYGDAENEPKEADMNKLVEEIFHTNLLLELINMKRFEFEARKDVAQVYNFVLRQKKPQAVDYVKAHPQILRMLVDGYNDPEIALNSGSILREVIRHEELNELLLNDPHMFDAFFEYVQLSTFDVASDAFATFKVRRQRQGRG